MSETAKKEKKRRKPLSHLRGVAVFLFILNLAILAAYGPLAGGTNNAIAKGVTINQIEVGGKTAAEAKQAIRDHVAKLELAFMEDGSRKAELAFDPGQAQSFQFQIDDAVAQADNVGKTGNPVVAVAKRLRAAFGGTDINLAYSLDTERLADEIRAQLGSAISPPRNARLVVRKIEGRDQSIQFAIEPEKYGTDIDTAGVLAAVRARLALLSDEPIPLTFTDEPPTLTATDLEGYDQLAEKTLERAPIDLIAAAQTWTVAKTTLAEWLQVQRTESGVKLGIDRKIAGEFLKTKATELPARPTDAIFEMTDGKVTKFIPAVNGESIDLEQALTALEAHLFSDVPPATGKIKLTMAVVEPEITNEKANPYGIKEIIGIGESNFKGSPRNRRTNITAGAKSVNGTIIPPGEEFSLLKTLGTIDDTSGYVKELVIKGNKTTPEFGGGLCQIGTTTFRGVLDSGLPVTARQNHSYRVPYYERAGDGSYIGPGIDATIYDPAPDFKFLNDTGTAILIMTKIKGDRLTFTFWGKKDGRKATQSKVKVWDTVPPPEKKIIETTDLPIGQEKCTESPHPGAKASFNYTITYADGTENKRDFLSIYRPWGEVCLLGVDPAKLTAAANGATTTPTTVSSADAVGVTGN